METLVEIQEKLLEALDNNERAVVKTMLSDMNTADIAEILAALPPDKTVQVFRLLSKNAAADVFAYAESDTQQVIIQALKDSEIGEIVNRLFPDDAADFIEEMPANVVPRIIGNLSAEKRRVINQLLLYPEDSAGSIMTTEFVELTEDRTVDEAFRSIREKGINSEAIYTCYVIQKSRHLVGLVSVKTLLLAKPDAKIKSIMDTKVVFAHTLDDQEAVAAQFRKYALVALPVVDMEERLVGIVTADDIVNVIEEENTEDIEKMNALAPSDDPYLKTSVFRLARNRITWLLVLMLSATVTGTIIARFEDALALIPALVAFIPMLMDTGGNAGAQSSTLIIRGMALGEIRVRDVLRVLWMELRIGALCGAALGVVNFVRIYLMNGRNAPLAFAVTISLFFTVLMAKSVGSLLPIVAKKLNIDPAIMAAPLITTIIDGASLIVYFSIASVILQIG